MMTHKCPDCSLGIHADFIHGAATRNPVFRCPECEETKKFELAGGLSIVDGMIVCDEDYD